MTPEQLQQLIDALAAQGGAVDSLNEKLQDLTNSQLELLAAQNQASDVSEQRVVAAAQREIDARQRTMVALDAQEAAVRRSLETMAESSKKTEAKSELIDIEIEKLKLLTQSEDASTEAGKRAIEEMVKKIKQLEKQRKALEKHQKAVDDLAGSFGTLFSGTAPEIGSLLNAKNLKSMADKFKDVNGGVAGFIKAGAPQFAMEFATSIAKLALELGDTENAFMKATGASKDFARSISNTYEEGRIFTATAEDMGASATSLFNNFTDFSYQDRLTRESLIETGAVLDKLGISNETFAQGVQLSTKALGMSADEAGQAMLDLSGFAEELGVSPEKLSAQFLEAGDAMAKLGEAGDEAFRDLAAASKVTGLEVSKLLNIVNQFDTFEGAARQAGKLNAALGGNFVNAMDLMMETDPTARFEMIRDSILDTGLSFDEMSYYQKNFYKDAMGLESVGDLALVLSGNMDSVSEETKKTTADFEKQAARAKTLASFQEQLNSLFAQMIPIVTPLIDMLRSMMDVVTKNATAFKILGGVMLVAFGGIPGMVIALISLFDMIKLGKDDTSLLSIVFEGLSFAIEGLADMFVYLYEAFRIDEFVSMLGELTGSMEASEDIINVLKGVLGGLAVGLIAVTLPISGTAAAIVGLVAGVAALMKAFSKKNSPSFFDMFTGGMLEQAFDALMIPFKKFEAVITYIGDIFKTIVEAAVAFFNALTDPSAAANIEKIAEAIDGVSRTKALALGSAMANTGEALQIQASVGNNDVMNKSMETAAGLSEATFNRTAAPTAANTNIASNSSNNTYVSSGPESAEINVSIGGEHLERYVKKFSDKRTTKAIAGRS